MRGTATTSTAATAAVVLAFLTTTTAGAAPAGSSAETRYCTPNQIETALSPLDSHMGRTSGEAEFRARPGNNCLLAGAPVLMFEDATGQPLPIAAEYPRRGTRPARVDERREATAVFTFDRVDGRTGEPLHGPIPDRVAVLYPIPGDTTSVHRPWDRRVEVPGPVRVGPVRGAARASP